MAVASWAPRLVSSLAGPPEDEAQFGLSSGLSATTGPVIEEYVTATGPLDAGTQLGCG
jgi:hypothetical protein